MTNAKNAKQYNLKLTAEALSDLQKVQGYGMIRGRKESQSDIMARLIKAELSLLREEEDKEEMPV